MTHRLRPNTQHYRDAIQQSATLLANSLFVLYLLLLLVMGASLFILLQRGTMELSIGVVAGIALALIPLGWLFNKLLRTETRNWIPVCRRVVWIFTNPIINTALLIIIVELGIFVFLFDRRFTATPSGIAVIVVLLGIYLAIVWGILSYPFWRSLVDHPIWEITSLLIVLMVGFVFLVDRTEAGLREVSTELRIRGYAGRDLGTFDEIDTYRFWEEFDSISQPNVPYIGHRSSPFVGDYFNIDENGLRQTLSFSESDLADPVTIHFYGGSTMWGYGARDDYTIPSAVARVFNTDTDYDIHITNFADNGYNSFQDKAVLDAQIFKGNVPDIAVLYHGYNDLILRLLRRGYIGADPAEVPIMSIPLDSPEGFLEYYTRYVTSLQAIASAHDIELIFVWQPMWFDKSLTESEEDVILRSNMVDADKILDIYDGINSHIDSLFEDLNVSHFLNYVDLFASVDEGVFIDVVHLNEVGNQYVADNLVTYITENILERHGD